MRKPVKILIIFLALTPVLLYGQSKYCGINLIMNTPGGNAYYQEVDEKIKKYSAESSNQNRSTIVVPLVFHIVYNTPGENIDDSLIYQQVDRLNEDFQRLNSDTTNTPGPFKNLAGSMDIEFCLAKTDPAGNPTNGIIHVPTNETGFNSVTSYNVPDPVKHNSSGGSNAWNTQDYLNIWICNLSGATAYTAPPGNFVDPADDGIVCHYNHVGNSGVSPYGMGRSIVHEMGHWFSLKHVWGDDGGDCSGSDFITDTPNQTNFVTGCPSFPVTDSCTSTFPGVMYMNYMDYTSGDCRNLFSKDQTTQMENFYDAVMSNYYLKDKCSLTAGLDKNKKTQLLIYQQNNQVILESEKKILSVKIYGTSGRLLARKTNCNRRVNINSVDYSGIVIVKVNFSKSINTEARRVFLPN